MGIEHVILAIQQSNDSPMFLDAAGYTSNDLNHLGSFYLTELDLNGRYCDQTVTRL